MGLTMKKILDKYSDCDVFSLIGRVFECNITEEEFLSSLVKVEEKNKEEKRKIYENSKDKFVDYPEFDKLYEEIKKECYDFDCEENRKFYLNKHFGNEKIEQYKKIGITEERINEIKKDFFQCSFIADNVGKTTKYGYDNRGFFWGLYHDIAMMIDREKKKDVYCIFNGKSPLEQIPEELKEHFLYYEVSYFNSVTTSGGLMINYYFELNNETKKYLLQFRNDFYIRDLEDLAFYKNNEVKFYSCTHEGFNSIEFDYKNMNVDEIIDFINDEFYEEDNTKVIEVFDKLMVMEVNNKFFFKDLGIDDEYDRQKICTICEKLNLELVSSNDKEDLFENLNNDSVPSKQELPVSLCEIESLVVKKR